MGKATIIAAKGAGLYDVALHCDSTAYAARLVTLTATVTTIDAQLATLAGQISTAQATKVAALAALDAAISGKDPAAIQAAESKLINASAVAAGLKQTESMFKARRLAAAKGLETLQEAPPADQLVEVWCADYSEELTGEVGTIDLFGPAILPLLRPGYAGQAAYVAARDGLHRRREHMGPAELFYNAAVAAGWQIWKPTYRTGILTAVNGDFCSVALDAASLTQQHLDINVQGEAPHSVTPVAILENVPIVYMSCNGQAFTVGDAVTVLLEGQAWSGATVIGFVREPKTCGWKEHWLGTKMSEVLWVVEGSETYQVGRIVTADNNTWDGWLWNWYAGGVFEQLPQLPEVINETAVIDSTVGPSGWLSRRRITLMAGCPLSTKRIRCSVTIAIANVTAVNAVRPSLTIVGSDAVETIYFIYETTDPSYAEDMGGYTDLFINGSMTVDIDRFWPDGYAGYYYERLAFELLTVAGHGVTVTIGKIEGFNL